jgi:hypothetical protein
MKPQGAALAVFVVLTLVFASVTVLEYTRDTTTTETVTVTATGTQIQASSSSSAEFQSNGIIDLDSGGNLTQFLYTEWNASTPTTFTFANVIFTLSTNPTITNTGSNCWVAGYGVFNVTFADGSSETLSPCTLAAAVTITSESSGQSVTFPNDLTIRFTDHVNPQAGLLIDLSTGDVYILVSA